jgi:hypothetical protein
MDLSLKIRTINLQLLEEIVIEPCEKYTEYDYHVGDIVEWYSGGIVKQGEVLQIVPAGCYPNLPEQLDTYSFRTLGSGCCRSKDSYLVAVRMGGRHKLIRIYWPSTCQLRIIK